MSNNITPIFGRLKNVTKENPYVAGAIDIKDDAKNKNQQTINQETDEHFGEHDIHLRTHDTEIADRYTKEEVNNIVSRTPETDVIVIEIPAASQSDIAGWLDANTPSGTDPETGKSVRANKLYRVPGPDNTTFSEWAWNGTAYIMLANKDYGIDEDPTPDSNNVAKSGGIYKCLERGVLSHAASPNAVWWIVSSLKKKRVVLNVTCADANAIITLHVNNSACANLKFNKDIYFDFTSLGTDDVVKLYFQSSERADISWRIMEKDEFPEIQVVSLYTDADILSYYTNDFKHIHFRCADSASHECFPENQIGQFYIAVPTGKEVFTTDGEKYIWNGTELVRIATDSTVISCSKGVLKHAATSEAVWWNVGQFAGRKINLRIITDADEYDANMFIDGTGSGFWKIKKTWKKFDFSQNSNIKVYFSCAEDAIIEWEEYKDGVGAIVEVKKADSRTEVSDGDFFTADYTRIYYREGPNAAFEIFPNLSEEHSFYKGQIPTGKEFFLIDGVLCRWNAPLNKFDPYINGSSIIKDKEVLDTEVSFVRRVSGYDRWIYNLPLAPIKDVIDVKGLYIIKLTITTNPLVGHNGALYLNDSTLKTLVTFGTTPIGGVYVAECTVSVTKEDCDIAAGLGQDFLQLIWQYGDPSDSDACTYTIKSVIAESMIGSSSGGSSIVVNKISVKKDGTGNFTNVQDAINSITDASESNRYEIEIYDDFVSSAFTDLHLISNPNVHVESESSINSMVSYVTTKNWVSLVGKGGRRKIWFINPDIDTPANLFQQLHVMYVQGNGRLENLDIRIKGGRYGIHQDKTSDTSDTNPDVNATTEYIDCHIEHLGNDEYTNGSTWDTSAGLAACPSSGGTVKVVNSYIAAQTDPLICHLHKEYKNKIKYILEGTTVVCKNPNLSLDNIGNYMNDFGSNQRNELVMIGCNIPHLNGSGKQGNGYDTVSSPTDLNCGGIFVSGYGNEKAYIQYHAPFGIYVRSANFNSQVDVVGGTAKSLIFGDNPIIYRGDTKNYGIAQGNLGISLNGETVNGAWSYVRSLPYLLGNCANNPKTLIVSVGGTEYTITFNENYMTSDGSEYGPTTTPAINGTTILQEINNSFNQYFVIDNSADMPFMRHPHFIKLYSFSDCMEIGINTSNEAWKPWQCVKRDYTNGVKGWRLANAGEIPDGIVGERISAPYNGKYSEGAILLVDKCIFGCGTFTKYMNANAPIGTKLAVGADSYIVASQSIDAPFVIVSDNGTFVKN